MPFSQMRFPSSTAQGGHYNLYNATSLENIEWVLNRTRYKHRCTISELALLPEGTTSNEAVHSQLKVWLENHSSMYQSTLFVKLQSFHLGKFIAQQRGLTLATTVQKDSKKCWSESSVACRLGTKIVGLHGVSIHHRDSSMPATMLRL